MSRTPGHKGFPFPSLTQILSKLEVLGFYLTTLWVSYYFLFSNSCKVFFNLVGIIGFNIFLQGFENLAGKQVRKIKIGENLWNLCKLVKI